MKIIVIEDEFPAAERLIELIRKIDSGIHILEVIKTVKEGKVWFDQHVHPDLIFSDIQLADGLSFEIFEDRVLHSPVIFTTSFDEYALKAFRLKSIDYLLKPIKQSELVSALEKYKDFKRSFAFVQDYAVNFDSLVDGMMQRQEKKYKTCFLVKQQEELIPIPQKNIAYFYASNRHVCLVTREAKQYLVDHTMEELTKVLDPDVFFQLNRQFIAHLNALHRIHTHFNGALKLELIPAPGEEVMVSRKKAKPFKEWLEKATL